MNGDDVPQQQSTTKRCLLCLLCWCLGWYRCFFCSSFNDRHIFSIWAQFYGRSHLGHIVVAGAGRCGRHVHASTDANISHGTSFGPTNNGLIMSWFETFPRTLSTGWCVEVYQAIYFVCNCWPSLFISPWKLSAIIIWHGARSSQKHRQQNICARRRVQSAIVRLR